MPPEGAFRRAEKEGQTPVYTDIVILPASDTALDWVNSQLQFDASGRQYAPLP